MGRSRPASAPRRTPACAAASPVREIFLPPAGASLRFLAGQPAFAADAGTDGAPPAPALGDTALTSWVCLSAASDIGYQAQPDGACLYGKADVARPNIVQFTPVPAGGLPAGTTAFFPMPPWAGVSVADAEAYRRLETGALAATRRLVVYGASPRVAAPGAPSLRAAADDTTSITPQGFVATFGADGAWKQLTLARHGTELLTFTGIADPLHAALLTGQQFVVASNPAALGASFTSTRITLAGWVFDVRPDGWAQHGTIAVIKNCPRPLRDLVGELGAWTLAGEMNVNPAATQARLQAIIQDAENSRAAHITALTPLQDGVAGDDPDYAYFLDTVVDNPAWNGVVFLDAPVSTDHSSKDLDAVLAATDPAKLEAHHFGVRQTPVTGTPPVMGESSFFGLIRYREDPAPAGAVAGVPQRFQVLELKALFHNSLMQSFSSRIALTLNQLFGADATQRDCDGNALILVGSYQQRDDGPAYVFVQPVPSAFDLAGSALTAVEIDRAEFTAATGEAAGADTVTAAFTFWGSLRFAVFQGSEGPLDLLLYDSLVFAGLVLGFQFPKAARTDQSFALDVSGVRFDAGASVTRSGALAGHFPATVRGMLSADAAESPGALGFMTVGVSQLAAGPLGSPWFALVFDLDLGTAGALVAEAGLIASLSLAWAPSRDQTRFAAGLKLPGSSSASGTIGIQGVFALNIYSIDLVSEGGFALTLNGITFTFLKKKLPPGGTFDFYLFGDKDAAPGSRALGWYGVYKKSRDAATEPDAVALARRRCAAADAWRRALAARQP